MNRIKNIDGMKKAGKALAASGRRASHEKKLKSERRSDNIVISRAIKASGGFGQLGSRRFNPDQSAMAKAVRKSAGSKRLTRQRTKPRGGGR